MKYHELSISAKATNKRVGRGIGSGKGKTAGRGTKGQNARSGGRVRPGFEGGQNPLMKRLPKTRGRKPAVKDHVIIHTDQLNKFEAGSKITKKELHQAGLIPTAKTKVKLLLRGDINNSLNIEVDSMSKTAEAAIKNAGGSTGKGGQA